MAERHSFPRPGCKIIFLLVLLSAVPGAAANFSVSRTDDSLAVTSLRGAIIAANNLGGNNTITLTATTNVYRLTIQGARENFSVSGDLNIRQGSLTINGPTNGAVIDATGLGDRIFNVSSNASLKLSRLVLTGGTARLMVLNDRLETITGSGGAILNAGALVATRCTFTNNRSGGGNFLLGVFRRTSGSDGGAIYSYGTLTMTDCAISNNATGPGYGAFGGSGGGLRSDGNCSLSGCVIGFNRSGTGGGDSRFWFAGDGGGIFNGGRMTLAGCSVNNNVCADGNDDGRTVVPPFPLSFPGIPGGSGGSGGGIYNDGFLTVSNSAIFDNACGHGGKGGDGSVGGNAGRGGDGGGICNGNTNDWCSLNLVNTTVCSNRCGDGGSGGSGLSGPGYNGGLGGRGGSGGGVFNLGDLNLTSCTIAANQAGSGGSGGSDANGGDSGNGGGIFDRFIWPNAVSRNTLIALNTVGSGGIGGTNLNGGVTVNGADGIGADAYGDFTSEGYNLLGSGDWHIGFYFFSDMDGTAGGLLDPLLGPLQMNGGPTPTMALQWGSPAIEQGSAFGVHTDQRGHHRPRDYSFIANQAVLGDGSDIGAFELDAPVLAPLVIVTNGLGHVTPDNTNGLVVDSVYSITAVPESGFEFADWAGSYNEILTNKPTLQFKMFSNLVLKVNFVDATRPIVRITNPPPAAVPYVTNPVYVVAGTATNYFAMTNVSVSTDGGSTWIGGSSSDNWAHWQASVTLHAGTNLVLACGTDRYGKASAFSRAKVFYAVDAVLTVVPDDGPISGAGFGPSSPQEIGGGTFFPDYNNHVLHCGRYYTITARPSPGFGFNGWTDNTGQWFYYTGKTLTFMMEPGLTLIAQFADQLPPTNHILWPPNGLRVTTNQIVVTGSSSDNTFVRGVVYSINDTQWFNANTTNAWTNWTADVTLVPGTNRIVVTAVDIGFNDGDAPLQILYGVSAPLTVNVNGPGNVSTNYNGALLDINTGHIITATPKPGCRFVNWTDGNGNLLTNKPVLKFTMLSNLVLTANFADTNRPSLTVLTPTALTYPTNEFFPAIGKAADNVAVASVWCRLNSGPRFQPNTGDGWSHWNATLDLPPGTNTFAAYAVDTGGNVSPTNTVKFFYSPAAAALAGMKAVVTPDNGTLFELAFGATTFSQDSTDTNNVNGVGGYTYTKLSPGCGRLMLTYVAPPLAADAGTNIVNLAFSSLGVARYTNSLNPTDAGGMVFTSAPALAPVSLTNQSMVFVNNQGQGGRMSFTPTRTFLISLDHITNGFRNYTYRTYSPLAGLITETSSNLLHYVVLDFTATNHGSYYSEELVGGADLDPTDAGVFGLASQHPGGNVPAASYLLGDYSVVISLTNNTRQINVWNIVAGGNIDNGFFDVNPANSSQINGSGTGGFVSDTANTGDLFLNYYSISSSSSARSSPHFVLSAPPLQTAYYHLLFISPQFSIFTNNADGTIGAAVFK